MLQLRRGASNNIQSNSTGNNCQHYKTQNVEHFLLPGLVLFKMSTGLDVPRQLDLHVTKQRNHLELLQGPKKQNVNVN